MRRTSGPPSRSCRRIDPPPGDAQAPHKRGERAATPAPMSEGRAEAGTEIYTPAVLQSSCRAPSPDGDDAAHRNRQVIPGRQGPRANNAGAGRWLSVRRVLPQLPRGQSALAVPWSD